MCLARQCSVSNLSCQCCQGERLQLPRDLPVEVITTASGLAAFVQETLLDASVVALDVEWRPGSQLPALMQLATESSVALLDLVALRHLHQTPGLLKAILTNNSVMKLGWRFETDMKILSTWMPCLDTVENFVDVSDMVALGNLRLTATSLRDLAGGSASSTSLASFVKQAIGLRLCKEAQCSDWEARPLSKKQLDYAALDAYALILLANSVQHFIPLPKTLTVSRKAGKTSSRSSSTLPRNKHKVCTDPSSRYFQHPTKSLSRSPAKREAFIARFCVRNDVYSNCEIFSASGMLIAHGDKAKALWYVEKGLATLLHSHDENRISVRLNFMPEVRGGGSDFEALASVAPRKNRCVVCGTEHDLSRYHLVPKAYQKYFAVELKAHRSHDIVLLCVDCHELSNRAVMQLKLRIALEMSAPLKGDGFIELSQEERNVVKAATALLRGVEKIPEERVILLRKLVKTWWDKNVSIISELDPHSVDGLRYAARLGRKCPKRGGWQAASIQSENYRSHGQIVVETLMASDAGEDALHDFIVRWRNYFLSSMAPRFMPDDWRLHYRIPTRLVLPSCQNRQRV